MKNIFNLLYSEILKLRKCYTLLWIIVCGIFMPLISFIHYFAFPGKINFKTYIILDEWVMLILIIVMITILLSSYIFLREYTDNTIGVLYSYPISKISIFTSKIIIIYMIIVLIYVLNFILLFGGGALLDNWGRLLKNVPITNEFILVHLKLYLLSMVLLFSLVPLLVFITNLFRNPIVTVILGLAVLIINLLTSEVEWCIYSPLMLPSIPLIKLSNSVNMNIIYVLSSSSFIVGILLCIYQFSKLENL